MTVPPEDLAAIGQLAASYWALADLTEEIPLSALFMPDAVFDLGSMRLEGLAAIEQFFARRAEGMRESGRTTRHLASNLLALPEGPDRIRVRSTVMVYAASGELPLPAEAPSGIADFEDICLRQPDGRWLYHYRCGRTVFVGPGVASFAR